MSGLNTYFAVGDTDKSWGLYALNCGTSVVKPGAGFPSGGHPKTYQLSWQRGRVLNEYQMIYLIRGKGIFDSRPTGRIQIPEGTIMLIFPDIWHRYKPDLHSDWHTYWVGFNGILASRFISKLKISPESPLKTIGYQQKIVQVYLDILETSQTEYTGYQQVLMGDIVRLIGLTHAIQRKSEFKQHNINRLMSEAKLLLMQKRFLSMEAVAKEMNLGYSSFRKIFREYTGMSPGQYQMQHRIAEAVQLLNENKLSIKAIAAELGFESSQYFARIFKKKIGKSPDAFRRQIDDTRVST